MHSFEVWAPQARTVEVELQAPEQLKVPMVAAEHGWWRADVAQAGPGTDYTFSVDGGPGRPDPRSAWQPHGVHGPSRVFDADAHVWHSQWSGTPVLGKVWYELHLGTFTPDGTADAAIDRLDELVDLGIDVIEVMPVAAFPGQWGWGYDGVALYAVQDSYGGPAALQRLVDGAHDRGLAVCLDVVYNHLGPAGNYLGTFGPYFTDAHHTPWGSAVNLDGADAAPVREFLIENALRWLRDFRFDALRLDAVHALIDDSSQHLLAELADRVHQLGAELGRPLTLVAESDLNDAMMVTPTAAGGLGMDAQWDDDFHHALHALVTGERQGYYVDFGELSTFAQVLSNVFVHNGSYSTFREKDWGAPVDPTQHSGHQFVVSASNHDQVGNRATGDRPSQSLSPGLAAISAALLLTAPFTPMLFMGEEWATSSPFRFFTDHDDELGELVRQGRRQEFSHFGWEADQVPDPQDHATRDISVLNWDERSEPDHARMLAWYRDLIALRRKESDLRDGDLGRVETWFDASARTLVVTRGRCQVVVNLSDTEAQVPVATGARVEIAWEPAQLDGELLNLPPESAAVLVR